jgi:hypothetical protein
MKEQLVSQNGEDMFDFEKMNQQLYMALSMNLQGQSLAMIKNLEKAEDNGIKGWWKLGMEVTSMTGQRMNNLAKKGLQPKRVKKYADVNAAIDEWEMACQKYDEATEQKVPSQTKMFSIQQIVPEDLERDILKSNDLENYEKLRKYIAEQVAIRRDMKNLSQSGTSPLESDALNTLSKMWYGEEEEQCKPCQPSKEDEEDKLTEGARELFSMMKGMFKGGAKGGGKGKGGTFNGNCNHCGKFGHRASECYQKDKDMNEYRKGLGKGGGKGPGGKGYGGKGPQQKGGWGKGGAYSLGGQDSWGENQQDDWWKSSNKSWTLSLEKMPIEKPPGLKPALKSYETKNCFETLTREDLANESDSSEEEQVVYMQSFPKAGIGNYSKKNVKMSKMPKQKKTLSLFESVSKTKHELHPAINEKAAGNVWRKVKGVMDSGATESVAPPSMCPNYRVQESEGSREGQKYAVANGEEIENLGEQILDIITNKGVETQVTYQSADVSRPLNSVSEICDAGGRLGQHVIFGRKGGAILNLDTGSVTPFPREGGIYTFDFWVKPASKEKVASGFTRPEE